MVYSPGYTRQRNREPAQTARKYRLTRKTDGVSLVHDRQRHTRRGNPPRQQEPHMTQPAPQTPHAEAHTPACTSSATQTRLRTQKTAGTSPFGPAPAVRASRVPTQSQHKASEKLAKLARRQISRSALRRASRLPSRSRRSYGQTRSDRTERC